nr:glycosyltransferase [uncultured Ruegeria sp.]
MAKQHQKGFHLADGLDYLEFLRRLHLNLKPEWYFEVGTQTGASLRLSDAKSISVDPSFAVRHELIGTKPELYLFQQSSDEFFAENRLTVLGATVDLAFLDGMHLMEFLLRDFINTERYCSADSVIVMHDCVPWNSAITARQRGKGPTSDWTGDVWKIVPILQAYRPDLDLEIVDCAPTGLVIVTGLDPESNVLSDAYDEILARFKDTDIEEYGVELYFDAIDIVPAEQSRWLSACPRLLPADWKRNPDVSIKVAAPNRETLTAWGDYYFALGLAKAFSRLGYKTTIDPADEWYRNSKPGGIDLVLRGRANFGRQPGRKCLYWAISKGLRKINYAEADHVFWASRPMYDAALKGEMAAKSSLLPQGFDSDVMYPRESLRGDGIVFVGRNRAGFERVAVGYAARSGHGLKIWGPGWNASKHAEFVCDDHVENDRLSGVYGQADIVLNDHTPKMKENGQPSNRIFDTLACGSVPVSDDAGWLPDDMTEYVYLFEDEESFGRALRAASSESDTKRRKRLKFASQMRETHSFEARVRTILEVVESLPVEGEHETAAEVSQ